MNMTLFGESGARRAALGSHESNSGGTDEWLTPPEIINALGPFDVDPCSPVEARRPWPTAAKHYTLEDDGLRQVWEGTVWCNPPYANVGPFMRKLADHGDGIALLFARTETKVWHDFIWPNADSILFLKGRLSFYTASGRRGTSNAGAPSALIGYGNLASDRLRKVSRAGVIPGRYIDLKGPDQ